MPWLFNAITGELKEISLTLTRYKKKDWETFFETKEEATLTKRRALMKEVRLEDEIFRRLPQTSYLVSNYGRIKKYYPISGKEKIMMPFLKRRPRQVDYVCLKLQWKGKFQEVKVSKIVSLCFELKGTGEYIYHINKNQWDNSVTNLRYVTSQDLIKVPQRSISKSVIKLDPHTLEELEYYPSIREAGRCEFVSYESIRQCLKGVQQTAGGYKWKYDPKY